MAHEKISDAESEEVTRKAIERESRYFRLLRTGRITTEEVERIANRNDCLAAVTALRALAAERDELARSLGLARTDAYQRGYADGKRLAAGSGEDQP